MEGHTDRVHTLAHPAPTVDGVRRRYLEAAAVQGRRRNENGMPGTLIDRFVYGGATSTSAQDPRVVSIVGGAQAPSYRAMISCPRLPRGIRSQLM